MNDRLERLRAMGISESVLQLAGGPHPSDLFFFRCQEPRGEAPPGLVPLWECGDWITAARPGPEFVGYSLEDPQSLWPFATSEQGLLADLFSDLVEDEDWDDEEESLREIREAAEAVGFRHLEDLLSFQESHGNNLDYAEELARYTRGL